MNKIKNLFIWFTVLSIVTVILIFSVEAVQKKVFDVKADLVGTDRTVTFYSKINGQVVKQYSDKDARFQIDQSGAISVWLGSNNKKVFSNMDYIIEDN